MIDARQLTDEQRAVVHHGDGPAVVLAVPGAGKTTAVVHRVRVLVEERGVPPDRILVSSFNRSTVDDLDGALHALGVRGVDTRTLHGLGRALLREHRDDDLRAGPDPAQAAHRLARRALRDYADERDLHPADLELSPRDVVDRVAAWKQQLAYADPSRAALPSSARAVARTADPENDTLLTLYRRFEAHRRREDWVTYADMIRGGWEALVRTPALRSRLQEHYEHVIVDEFQDVGRAQFHLLDQLTAAPRNYMVVGDDDQCIYRWRGADPALLLDFAERYDAAEYRLQTSFRLPAGPLVLASAVIRENENRRPKRLRLSRGVGEACTLIEADDPQAEARRLTEIVDRLQSEQGYSLDDMVVLVRTYGQTPPIEQALIDRSVPYRVRGHPPFYRRRPVQTLLRYLYWAVLERTRRRESGFADPDTARQYLDRFAAIINRPNRYVERGRIDHLRRQVRRTHDSVLTLLADQRAEMDADTADRVETFITVATALVNALDAPPAETLDGLVEALDYETVLREESPTPVRGEMRVQTTRALIRYAEAFESSPALLRGVRSLAGRRRDREASPCLEIRSIHRAKGAEWPVVFLPGCTQGTLPLESGPDRSVDLAEERRLFYVGLTRSRSRLYLSRSTAVPPSQFLKESEAGSLLPHCDHLRRGLTRPASALSDRALARLCQALGTLDLDDYVHDWWSPSSADRAALETRLRELEAAAAAARERKAAYREARAAYEEARSGAAAEAQRDVEALRETIGAAPLGAELAPSAPSLPADAALTFDLDADDGQVRVYWRDQPVGTLDPFASSRLDVQTVLSVPWAQVAATLEGVRRGRLRFSIDWPTTEGHLLAARRASLSPPDPPPELDRLLTSTAVQKGYTSLQERIREFGGEP